MEYKTNDHHPLTHAPAPLPTHRISLSPIDIFTIKRHHNDNVMKRRELRFYTLDEAKTLAPLKNGVLLVTGRYQVHSEDRSGYTVTAYHSTDAQRRIALADISEWLDLFYLADIHITDRHYSYRYQWKPLTDRQPLDIGGNTR